MQGSMQQPRSLWPAQPSHSSSPASPCWEPQKNILTVGKSLPHFQVTDFCCLHICTCTILRWKDSHGFRLQSLAAVLFSRDFSDSFSPLKMVPEQCKYTHLVQEHQLSKSSLCSPGWSTEMLISASLIQPGRRAVLYFGMVLTLTGLQQPQALTYELHLLSFPGAVLAEKLWPEFA